MPPKRTKSGSGSAQGQKWEQGLLTTPFLEEGKWEASIVFVEGDVLEDYQLIDILHGAVNAGLRKLFSVITKKDTIEQVHELGNPKGKKPKEIPLYSEVCEPCKMHLDAGDEIPIPLLAKLLKFRLLDIKTRDVKRRETEKKGGGAPKSAGKKGDKKERTKSPAKGKGGGGKKTPEPPSPKGDTKLRKRGEEDTDSKYIDDEPDEGPEHYIFISGFYYPHLLGLMEELGLHVDAVIRCHTEDREKATELLATLPQDANQTQPEGSEFDGEVAAVQESASLRQFWKDLLLVLQAAPPESRLHDLARLDYTFACEAFPGSIEDPEKKLEYGTALFEDVACLVYDLYDWKHQWKAYLEHLRLLNVPNYGDAAPQPGQDLTSQHSATPAGPPAGATGQPGPASESGAEKTPRADAGVVDMRCYTELMNSVPQESVSVPLVMHCMLEQIVASEEDLEPPSETPRAPRADGLSDAIAAHLGDMAFTLALSQDERQVLSSELDPPKSLKSALKQPKLVYYRDRLTQRIGHLEGKYGMNLMEAEQDLLKRISLPGVKSIARPAEKLGKERAARLQELMQHCSTAELTQAEIDRAFKQFVFESMDLSSVECDSGIIESEGLGQPLIPWDDPYPYFKGVGDVDVFALAQEAAMEEERREAELLALMFPPPKPPGSTTGPDSSEHESQGEGLNPRPPSSQAPSTKSRQSRSKKRSRKGSSKEVVLPPEIPPEPPKEETSRPNSGILKSPAGSREGSATSRKSMQSVHFERTADGQLLPQPGDTANIDNWIREQTPAHDIDDVRNVQKRNLDQWCFAEHLDPNVLQQVLVDAYQTLPCVDTYYHRRDHSLLVALHNPSGPDLTNRVKWHAKLHSNVGFRNYLEHIADDIHDWTRQQDAKHQANQLATEVDKIQREGDAGSRPGTGKGKKGRERSKSPKKTTSRAGRSSSRGSSTERPTSANLLVREGSLKAQKEEMDRLRLEAEEAEKSKGGRRSKSAGKKASKDGSDKKAGSRSSSKTGMNKDPVDDTPAAEEPVEAEPFWPFTGYDVGNNLIHVNGVVTTMFPADGAQIKTERIDFEQGATLVKTSLQKDGHAYHIHVLNPKDHSESEIEAKTTTNVATEKADIESSEKDAVSGKGSEGVSSHPAPGEPDKPVVGQFGSLNTVFNDGMSIAFSIYGDQGECEEGKKYEPVPFIPPLPTSPSPVPDAKASPSKAKGGKGGKASTPEPTASQPAAEEETETVRTMEEPAVKQNFQQLHVACPDGLCVNYLLESELGVIPQNDEERRLVVRQSYPFKTHGMQQCESSRSLMNEETSRLILSDGTIVKFMTDGGVTLLYPDGKVSELSNYPPNPPSRSSSPQRAGSARSQNPAAEGGQTPTKKGRRQKSAKQDSEASEDDPLHKSQCVTTLPSGERIGNHLDGTKIDVQDALVCVATDPQTNQALHTREDHVVSVIFPDSTSIIEHSDGTRITTFIHRAEVSREGSDCAETGEAGEKEIQESRFVRVECPGYATVKFDCETSECSMEFASGSAIQVQPSGVYDVYHYDGTFMHVDEDGTCTVQPRSNQDLEVHDPSHELRYTLKHAHPTLLETTDNEGNHFAVTNTGESLTEVKKEEGTEKGDCEQNEKDMLQYKQHAPRFFIMHPDGSGTELLRYSDVAEYLQTSEDDPMTAILTDPLADHPGVLGITVLKPSMKDMSQKWMNGYTQDSIIPAGLRSRDLKTLPAKEVKKEGPPLGQKVGQGLSIGSQIPATPPLPVLRCPTELELRQLIQYRPVSEELRQRLTSGLREYAEYVQGRNATTDSLLVCDPRDENEREQARRLQEAVAGSLAESNKAANRIQGDLKDIYEKATVQVEASAPPTPQPRRTRADWECDSREVQLEMENRKALREHYIPPYFESELGKAFLLSQAPDMATLARELAEVKELNMTDSSCAPTPQPDGGDADCSPSQNCDGFSPSYGVTPSGVRPGNPTPGHGLGGGSPAPLRPVNPSPNQRDANNETMEERPGNKISPEARQECRSSEASLSRTEPVRLPAYIHGRRPGASENNRFSKVEDPVRRRVNTSSIAGATQRGGEALSEMRGFDLLPGAVDFGTLKEGNTYAFTVYLKNTGTDTCRFKVRQPPPSTGLKICYKPGPVAAGMKAELALELYAIAVGVEGDNGVGGIDHNIEIVTETDHLFLPVSAVVLTAHEYEQQGQTGIRKGKNAGVQFITNRPPGGHGIIRPRRQEIPA